MLRLCRTFCAHLRANETRSFVVPACFSTRADRHEDAEVVLSDTGDIVVCWHPQPRFPYECSQPLPQSESEHDGDGGGWSYTDDLSLTLDGREPLRLHHAKTNSVFQQQQLMELTGTSKHSWYPNKKIRNRKKNPPKDRPFL